MTTLTLISLFAIGVIVSVFNNKLNLANYEAKYYKEKFNIEQEKRAKSDKYIEDLLAEDRRKSIKILDKNKQIELLTLK